MTLLQNLLILISLFTLPFGLFGQANENYENEEINVINHLLDKLVKEEKLSAINNLLSYQLGYLLTKQMSNLDKEPHLKGSYKSNKLLKKTRKQLFRREIS